MCMILILQRREQKREQVEQMTYDAFRSANFQGNKRRERLLWHGQTTNKYMI